jgi:hypothetical protein
MAPQAESSIISRCSIDILVHLSAMVTKASSVGHSLKQAILIVVSTKMDGQSRADQVLHTSVHAALLVLMDVHLLIHSNVYELNHFQSDRKWFWPLGGVAGKI